jgi:hypothetical protein
MHVIYRCLGTHSKLYEYKVFVKQSVPVAARSKVWVCDRWLAGIVGSNPAGLGLSVLSVVCCQVNVFASG